MSEKEPLLVVVLGATASGKTALSLRLAEAFQGEIVNCDSVAVYRDLEIGTAKPSAEERLRAPHHMLDIVSPETPYTAGDYSRDARSVLRQIVERQHLPIVAGGTGLYLRALLLGLFAGPPRSETLRDRLRKRAARQGSAHLHKLLTRLDPASAAQIHANDTPKLMRALEICVTARQPMSQAWSAGREPLQGFRMLRIGLDPPRAELYARINQRAAVMFERGLVEETKSLIERYGSDCRPLASLGYKQAGALLQGALSRDAAIAATQQGHRNYAKRQATWFRREPEVHWLQGFGDDPETETAAMTLVRKSR
ncbi:MAG TPA: tRNA (adenosine(37)-N6)-dimethylallyltransferase MiaA [Acidobacteriaceae bacterium]|nr:tRNA (adenosine(37)-N6)-dimethylallyltransferase MiaA [Acidobacteriaceae bacterium]